MTAPSAPRIRPARFWGWFGFAGIDDVQRVERYTRWSFHALVWFFFAMLAYELYGSAREPWQGAVTLAATAGVCGVASPVLNRVLDHYPRPGIPPYRVLAVFVVGLVAVTAWGLAVAAPDEGFVVALVVTVIVGLVLGGIRVDWVAWVLVAYVVTVSLVAGNTTAALVNAVVAAFLIATMRMSLWMLGVVRQLDRARRTEAELAVAEERLRFSRDVHDVLGRHLSVIAVQSELAAAMVERGDGRAADRIREVRATAHDALREARELARGYRELDLAHELLGAVALLNSAQITTRVIPEGLDGLPERWHEPVARVVREAVTNVLRHSSATRVDLVLGADGDGCQVLEIRNDRPTGVAGQPAGSGSGLRTLARDLAVHGVTLQQAREETTSGDEFVLRVMLGAPVPASHEVEEVR